MINVEDPTPMSHTFSTDLTLLQLCRTFWCLLAIKYKIKAELMRTLSYHMMDVLVTCRGRPAGPEHCPHLLHPMLGQVDVEVDGAVEHCQEVGHLAHLLHPKRPSLRNLARVVIIFEYVFYPHLLLVSP